MPPSAIFLVTSGSLVFLYLASRSESWALIYLALSQSSCDYTCDQSQVLGGQREEARVALLRSLGLERRGRLRLRSVSPCSPLVTVTVAGRPQGRSAKKQERREHREVPPPSLHLRSPLSHCSSQKEGLPAVSVPPYGSTQVSGHLERPGR